MATIVANKNPFWGMIIYERCGDGTLQGEWKNNRQSYDTILNEIARKRDNGNAIEGTYTVSWIEEDNEAYTGVLIIARIQNDTAFSLVWEDNNGVEVFRGMGMPIGLNKIAVTYWNPQVALQLNF